MQKLFIKKEKIQKKNWRNLLINQKNFYTTKI